MIKAVVFDMDGVLIDAKEWHYESLNRALRLFGYEISRYAHLSTYDGLPTRKKLEMLSVESGLPQGLHSFLNDLKQRYTLELVARYCKPNFIHEYALSRLKAEGMMLGLASNSIRSTVEIMMRNAELDAYMDVMLSNEDVTSPKPDPEIYINVMNRLRVDPAECLIIEDNENGIKAANASGAHVLVVNSVIDSNYQNITKRIKQINLRTEF